MKQNLSLNFNADYMEHCFEARVMLPQICDALRNRLFVFTKHQTRSDFYKTDADFKNQLSKVGISIALYHFYVDQIKRSE